MLQWIRRLVSAACLLSIAAGHLQSGGLCAAVQGSQDTRAKSQQDEDSAPLNSLILLRTKSETRTAKEVVARIEAAARSALKSGAKDADLTSIRVQRTQDAFQVVTGVERWVVEITKTPYLEKDDIQSVEDLRTRRMLQIHQAAILITALPNADKPRDEMANSDEIVRLCRFAAEFVDGDTCGLIIPSENLIVSQSEGIVEQLRSAEPLKALREAGAMPVVSLPENDPELAAAAAEAKRRWPEFVRAYQEQRADTRDFAVKFTFAEGGQTESMWVTVISLDARQISGTLANDPVLVRNLRQGSRVQRKVSEITDWMYFRNDSLVGGYSVQVILNREKAKAPDGSKTPE